VTWLVPVGLLVLVALGSIGLAIWRGPIFLALTVICLALAGVVAYVGISGEEDPTASDPHPDADFRIVALGDSYMSGEGAPAFLAGTDRPGTNECRRASTAHAFLAAVRLEAGLTFLACSGADTEDVMRSGQYDEGSQIKALEAVEDPGVVIISIGGNDASFSEIGFGCAFPTEPDCRRSADGWIRELDRKVFPALESTYRAVRTAARGAPVFALTYPNPLGPRYCRDLIWMSRPEFAFLRDVFIPRLNTIVATAAARAGVRVIALDNALVDYRICDVPLSRAGVNFVTLSRTGGTPLDLDTVDSLIHGTFHPNKTGHERLAAVVIPALLAAREGSLEPLPPASQPGLPPPPFVPEELGPPAGPSPFPSDTDCDGTEIATVTPVSMPAATTSLPLTGAKPRSRVCYRGYRDVWRSLNADAAGAVNVPVDLRFEGLGSINEIVVERPNDVWEKLVVSRLGA
jgi:hypothetical protein